ncbi:MAG: hypothetical protein ACKVT2_07900 [Saprospiraceae bacterium]
MINNPNPLYVEAARQNFVVLCLDALQRGYDRMVSDAQYDVSWKEDKLTVHLVKKMEETGFLKQNRIDVQHQSPIYDNDVIYGSDDPANAPVIDFKFIRWQKDLKFYYFAEAKNLSENDWAKNDGSNVSASFYRGRYIDTGIQNFISNRYPEGCLVGYIVEGSQEAIIKGINRLIQRRGLSPNTGFIEKDLIVSFPTCFCSSNSVEGAIRVLYHIMMKF